jgi:membrane fusion protein (multidrug efflux system)
MQQSSAESIHLRSRIKGKQAIPVNLILDNNSDSALRHEGTLKFSEVTVEETTGSVALRALVSNEDGLLLPGLFVRARLNLGQDEALLVPQRATTRTPTGTLTVWVVDEKSQAQQRTINAVQAYQDSWIISDGLKAGDNIIVEGYQKVGPGSQVSPSPWEPAGRNKQISEQSKIGKE